MVAGPVGGLSGRPPTRDQIGGRGETSIVCIQQRALLVGQLLVGEHALFGRVREPLELRSEKIVEAESSEFRQASRGDNWCARDYAPVA